MSTHFAFPAPVNGMSPSKGRQTCRTCGQPIERAGRFIVSDGVRGSWRHAEPELTRVQAEVVLFMGGRAGRLVTARGLARRIWPEDPGWQKRTRGAGRTGANGAMGATMPLRAGRVLSNLERKGVVFCDQDSETLQNRWGLTETGIALARDLAALHDE